MACGGLIPVALLWPLALWPLARYIEYKAAVDEFCRFLLADGATEPAASQDDSKSSGDDNTP